MKVWSIIVILAVALTQSAVMAQEKVCSSFCTTLGTLQSSPGKSCDDIYQTNKMSRGISGLYWINTTSGIRQVHCNMELQCGGHKGGWTRIANFDTSQGDPCPLGWNLITTSGSDPAKNVCRSADFVGCHSTTFDTYNISFYKICGKVKGYQKGNTNAFAASTKSIDEAYVDGVSITLGSPRKHVWTYAIGLSDSGSSTADYYCPCAARSGGDNPPPFVGDHYYCESGDTDGDSTSRYYTSDPVWDGLDCSISVSCCAQADMPWFLRQFATAQKTFVEARICRDENFSNEDTLVESMELYIQ